MLRNAPYHRLCLLATGAACLAASGAAEYCAGSAQLDSLGALVAGIAQTGDPTIKRTLIGAVLAYELPEEVDVAPRFRSSLANLREALEDAGDAAASDPALQREVSRALAGLGSAIDQSGCRPERGQPDRSAEAARPDAAAGWRNGDGVQSPYSLRALAIFLGAICTAATLCLGGVALYRRFEPRRSPRHHYVAPVTVACGSDGERWTASALDISRSGMKLSGGPEIARGMRLTLAHNGLTQTAIVRWSNEFYYGVEFRPPLSRHAMRDLLRRHAQTIGRETKTAPA
mgnify:CR=1 FL=1